MESGRPALPIFVNPLAGAGDRAQRELRAALERVGIVAEPRPVHPDDLGTAVARSAAAGLPVIGVAGGDGSMRAAAAVLAGRAAALAPFPGGTLNHFARRYGLPTIEDVASAVATGATRRVPVAVLDDEIFLNTATFGYYAEVVRRRERWRRWLSKWPAAVLAMASLLRRNPAIDVELEVDDRRIRRTTALVWIGLGWGSFPRSHQAAERRQAPDLEVAVLRVTSRRELVGFLLRMIPRLVRSERPVNDPALELFHARSVILAGPHVLHATMDGERFELCAPVFVAVLDDALLVPVGTDAGA